MNIADIEELAAQLIDLRARTEALTTALGVAFKIMSKEDKEAVIRSLAKSSGLPSSADPRGGYARVIQRLIASASDD